MISRIKFSKLWIILLCCVLLIPISFVGCKRGEEPEVASEASDSQGEADETPASTETLDQPTDTVTKLPPTPTEILKIEATVNVASLRVREGPGTNSRLIAGLRFGNPISLIGRNGDGTWVKFDQGWVAAEFLLTEGEIYILPVVTGELDSLFTSTPKPTKTFTPTRTPTYTLTSTSTSTATRTSAPSATGTPTKIVRQTTTVTTETSTPSKTPSVPTTTP
ncbi:MAG: SH3 domain-containing protein [Anaerolineales bacterium]|nr:SH3 domain-containing protein [Chloroflexota bacterium]MBL6981674.1 SH3 domain-containing protein [Anaerolineales bacterium]